MHEFGAGHFAGNRQTYRMKAIRMPLPRRVWIYWMVVLLMAGGVALQAKVPEALAGDWTMVDESPSLSYPSNPTTFTITRAVPGKSQWADGSFYLKWPRSARPDRGYYSLKTGRIWVTTYRWVDEKQERVEYQGVLTEDGNVVWKGIGKTTGRLNTSWDFTATKR
jgi:hypothetical protein